MSVALWRIALASRTILSTDLSGRAAERSGGRWNRAGKPVVYTSTSIALACLETVVHLNVGGLPLNRVLVRVDVPDVVWARRHSLPVTGLPDAWNALPVRSASAHAGNLWLDGLASSLLMAPSVIVPEEFNVLLNPRHADALKLRALAVRPWTYDARLLAAGVRF